MRRSYNALIIILAAISIILSMLDINGIISIVQKPYIYVDASIWLVFVFDYFYGLMAAKDKRFYFRTHIWDLLAIIPLNALFSFFRFNRIFKLVSMQRILLVFRFARLAGIIGKLQLKLKTFLKTNNIVYLFYVCGLMLLVSSFIYSLSEHVSLGNAFWWALATVSTVGYGDISPHTFMGRLAAALLMILGVGFIGMLTSTLTKFFTEEHKKANLSRSCMRFTSSSAKMRNFQPESQRLSNSYIKTNAKKIRIEAFPQSLFWLLFH